VAPVELDYYACDLATGVVVEELLSLTPSSGLSRTLGSSVTANADLALAGAPPDWVYATQPGRSMVVAVDRLTQQPIWAGLVLTRQRGSDPTAQLGLVTPEAYLDRRYTGTYDASGGADRVAIMTGVSSALLVDAPPFIIDAPAIGITGVHSVQDGDDRTVLSVLQELQQMDGWPEWTVDAQWADAQHSAVQLILRIRQQIGVVRPDPEAAFDLPGCITTYSQLESYEAGKGATDVLAWGEGEGPGRLHSDAYTADDLIAAGWPRWVYRYTPASNTSSPIALNASAALTIAQMRLGSSVWTVGAAANAAPRLGADWALGDSIRVQIASSDGHPDGAEVVARAYGWTLDPAGNVVTPILVEGGA
jgi:hypothetical protein